MLKQAAHLAILAGFVSLPGAAFAAGDRIVGLLELPELFGGGPCERFEVKPLPLYGSADSTAPVGEIREDVPWTFGASGGCGGRRVGLHGKGDWDGKELATREFGYETPGAIVLARRGTRYRILLDDSGNAAWIEPGTAARYYPLEELASERLAYLDTAIWSGRICDRPGEPASCRDTGPWSDPRPTVSVFGHRRARGELWFEVEVPPRPEDSCGEPTASPRHRGWIRAYEGRGAVPAIWFYSRGC